MIFIVAAVVVAIIAFFVFGKKKTTDPAVVAKIEATDYSALLDAHIDYYHRLDPDDKTRFETLVKSFLTEVNIEGVGTDVTDIDRVMVASSAVIPIFGFPEWRYNNLTNVILYPDTFDNQFQYEGDDRSIMGMVGSGYMNGQMLLSRAALIKGFSTSSGKENTAIHEFVHLLDKADGATDGVPENLMDHEYATPWLQMLHREMHRIEAGKSDINPYAITNEAEFLAVAAEYFFSKPDKFKDKHPEIYEQLSRIFSQDPASSKL